MANKKEKYHPGKIVKLWDYLVELHKTNPEVFQADGEFLRQHVARSRWSLLNQKEQCPSCLASMKMYKRKPDYFVVSLVRSMGSIVEENLKNSQTLTEANQVHVNADNRIPHNARNMTGIASALGLIAPGIETAHWVITRRGFDALGNRPIPDWVVTFRDEIVERSDTTTTFADVMAKREKKYEPQDWYEIAGLAEGSV